MASVTCPNCGTSGRINAQMIGTRIRCKACGNPFVVGASAKSDSEAAAKGSPSLAALVSEAPPARPRYEGIEVEGLDEAAWTTAEAGQDEAESPHAPVQEGATVDYTTTAPGVPGAKQYKVLSPRDAFFGGKFDLELLEKAVNHYARQGWVVKGVATPHVVVFGAEREQIVILMER